MAKRARTKRIPATSGDGEGYLGGQLLIATPSMQDPRFAGSIICVCAHSEEGAMGLVLNRPMEGLSFDDLLKQLDLEPVPAQRSIRLPPRAAGGATTTGPERGLGLSPPPGSCALEEPGAELAPRLLDRPTR